MDLKRQTKYLNKCLRVLKGKNSQKIRTFSDLAKAVKISLKTFRFYELHLIPEIAEIIKKNRHENKPEKTKKKLEPNFPQKKVKNESKLLQKNEEDKRIRSYEEIKAKLFIYKAYKTKKYAVLTKSAQNLIDRQIGLLEWVLLINKKEDIGDENGHSDNTGE